MIVKNKITNCRTCLVSNKKFEKSKLVRLVKHNNNLIIDKSQKMFGRGYWIHLNDETLKNPKIIQILSKKTKCKITQDFIEELINYEKTK